MFKIRKLEAMKKIEIPREVSLEEFNSFLRKWEREDIIVK
jgi:hypothetical protein